MTPPPQPWKGRRQRWRGVGGGECLMVTTCSNGEDGSWFSLPLQEARPEASRADIRPPAWVSTSSPCRTCTQQHNISLYCHNFTFVSQQKNVSTTGIEKKGFLWSDVLMLVMRSGLHSWNLKMCVLVFLVSNFSAQFIENGTVCATLPPLRICSYLKPF